MERMMTRKQVAERLHLDTQTIDDWRFAGKLPFKKIGHFVRIPAEAVEKIAEERRALEVVE